MNITLAQCVQLLSSLNKKEQELRNDIFNNYTIEIPKGEKFEKPTRTVEDIFRELNDVQADILNLDDLIKQANMDNTIEWDGKHISVIRAIETAKQLRSLVSTYKMLGETKQRVYTAGYGSGTVMETVALFDPEKYRKLADKTSRQAELLSSKIDRVNYTVEVNVPFATKYLEVS